MVADCNWSRIFNLETMFPHSVQVHLDSLSLGIIRTVDPQSNNRLRLCVFRKTGVGLFTWLLWGFILLFNSVEIIFLSFCFLIFMYVLFHPLAKISDVAFHRWSTFFTNSRVIYCPSPSLALKQWLFSNKIPHFLSMMWRWLKTKHIPTTFYVSCRKLFRSSQRR